MPEEGHLVPWSEASPETQSERLTAQFYEWEKRGRGWQLWDFPVELEPPFVPFIGHYEPAEALFDDARKPTIFSSLIENIRSRLKGVSGSPEWLPPVGKSPWVEPEPEIFCEDSPLAEIQVALPPNLRVTRDVSDQFLMSLRYCSRPLGIEIVGSPDGYSFDVPKGHPQCSVTSGR